MHLFGSRAGPWLKADKLLELAAEDHEADLSESDPDRRDGTRLRPRSQRPIKPEGGYIVFRIA